jgi:hypothetical protein
LPLAFCNWWLLRTEFSFHREPFALKSFYSPTDNSRMATEAFVKAATVPQLGRSIARQVTARAGNEAGSATIGAGKSAPNVFIGVVFGDRRWRNGRFFHWHGCGRHRRANFRFAPYDPC